MKKIIRLNEFDFVSLLKTKLMENKKLNFLQTLLSYEGKDKTLLDFKGITEKFGFDKLSENQKNYAYVLLKKEFPNLAYFDENSTNELYDLIRNDDLYKSLVIKKGKETYRDLLKSDKQFLFKDYAEFHNKNITIGIPDENWRQRNLNDLRSFYRALGTERTLKIVGLEVENENGEKVIIRMTMGEAITKYGKLLQDDYDSFVGFIEDGQWSSLNKIDTNYSYWAKVIIDLDKKGLLGDGSHKSKIEKFFEQKPISEICNSEEVNHIKKVESYYNVSIPVLSFAEYRIYKDGEKNYEFAKTNIKITSKKGDEAEKNFKDFINKNNFKQILDFSSPGNQVDMVFGVDLMVKFPNSKFEWTPVQVKSSEQSGKEIRIFDFNIGGIVVWPKKNSTEEWFYITSSNSKVRSFNYDLLQKSSN